MSDEAWKEFREEVKGHIHKLYNRLHIVESNEAVAAERDKNLSEKMDGLLDFFKSHDEHEIKKTEQMTSEIARINKTMYMATGAMALIVFIGLAGLKALIGG